MIKGLVAASILWPVLLGMGAGTRIQNERSGFAGVVYLSAGLVCHQRDDRSFHTHGVKWPVCARCSGLYLAAPIGALAALSGRRTTRARVGTRWLVLAAVPTLLTVGLEWFHLLPVTSIARAIAAAPLGAAIAFAIVRVTAEGEVH